MATTGVLGGRYRLIERLGQGGMSVVWRAHDEALGRPVAVKLLTARHLDRASSRVRILTEAQSAAKLSHPHITSVYDYGEAPAGRGRRTPYVVMELLSGSTLAERLRSGPLPVRAALQVCAQVAGALAAAHHSGVVHRDVKPANVMLTPTGAKVLDFGLAAAAGASEEFRSGGEVWGTPAYLAPERLAAGEVVPASDVYALGLLLYAALTSRRPWRAETVEALLDAHRYESPQPLPLLTGLPDDVAMLCHRCLAKQARDRPTAPEVARVLAEAVGWRVSHAALTWPQTPLVRVAAPQPSRVADDPGGFPTGPTVVHGRRRARAGATRWRALALSGSAAAVLASLLTGLSVVPEPAVLPEPDGHGVIEDTGGRLGTAVGIENPVGEFDHRSPVRRSGTGGHGAGITTGTGGSGDPGPTVADPPRNPPATSDPPADPARPTNPTSDPPLTDPPDSDPGAGTGSPSPTTEQPESYEPPEETPQSPAGTDEPQLETPAQRGPTAEPAGPP